MDRRFNFLEKPRGAVKELFSVISSLPKRSENQLINQVLQEFEGVRGGPSRVRPLVNNNILIDVHLSSPVDLLYSVSLSWAPSI